MLAGRVVTGAAVLIGARLVAHLIDFGALLVFARLLTPDDFGVVAAAMALISIVEAVLELPVGLVLVRTQHPRPDHYDTAFTLSVLRGVTLGLLVACIAWPYAWAFGDVRLVPVILCLGWAPMIRGCVSPNLWINMRGLRMGPACFAQTAGKVGAFAAAMVAVAMEPNYWALIVATVTSPGIMVITSYIIAPYRPRLSLKQWKVFWDFLSWMGGAQLVTALSWQCDRLILGHLSSRSELGRYTMADSLATLPIQALAIPSATILFPALGAIQVECERLRRGFLISLNAIYTLCLPVMVGLIILAQPICRTVLGPQWDDVVLPTQLLTAAGALSLIGQPLGALFNALGQTKVGLFRSIVGLAIKLPLMTIGGLAYGLIGVAFARLATECIMFAVSVHNSRKLTGASATHILSALIRPVSAVIAMTFALLALWPFIGSSDSTLFRGLTLAALVTTGALVYITAIVSLWIIANRPDGIEARAVGIARHFLLRILRGRSFALFPSKATPSIEVQNHPNLS